ncbi:MAG TPA: polymer-forming cytoskeletal protein [Gammaproteobacteria bacterium]|nr:polymer-forming cytoskeletal protein [Gammaproteobacteria bacterium]
MFDIKKGAQDKPADSLPRDAQRPEMSTRPEPSRSAASRDAAVIGPSIHIDGDVRGEEDLLIEGEVNGTVQLKNNSLTIGPNGKVRADVSANSVYVDGYMEGDLYGSERVHIRKSAQVHGNVTSPRVSLEDGAKFKGSIEMDPQAAQAGQRNNASRPAAPSAPKPAAAVSSPKPEAPAAVKTGAAS